MNKTRYSLTIAVAAVLASAPALADAGGTDACRQIDDDTARLACYDELFGRAEAPAAPEPAAPPPAAVATTPVAAPAAKAENDFGSEQLPALKDGALRARIVGTFNGWDGSTTFTLDNGQVWRQLRNNARPWKPREPMVEPMVTIEKGVLGSYRMRVDGVKRIVQVKRIN